MATSGMSECDTTGLDENTDHLVDRRAEAMPKLCPLDSPWARLARFYLKTPMMKFTALKRAG